VRRMDRKHCKWPLGLKVMVLTNIGYIQGRILKHDRRMGPEAWIDFSPHLVNMDDHGDRHTAIIPFRSMKPLPGQDRPKIPWYRAMDEEAMRQRRERRLAEIEAFRKEFGDDLHDASDRHNTPHPVQA
jgi:hypothetical protein